MLFLLADAAPLPLTSVALFASLLALLRNPDAAAKDLAAALLLRLLQLQLPPEAAHLDGRAEWPLARLLPLARAAAWHRSHLDPNGLLPRHAQLYAELVAAASGLGHTSACIPPRALEESRAAFAASPLFAPEPPSDLRRLALLGSALVALLDGYRRAVSAEGGAAGEGDLEVFEALPPPVACAAAHAVLRRWVHDGGEVALLPPARAEAEWSRRADAQLMRALGAFGAMIAKAEGRPPSSLISRADLVFHLELLRGGAAELADLTPHSEALLQQEPQRVVQRYFILCRLNHEVEACLAYAHTGWTAQPHTLGARLCALRQLLFRELKLRLWDAALPVPPIDEGVVKSGHVVTLDRYEAEEWRAAERREHRVGAADGRPPRSLFSQLFSQLDSVSDQILRRRDRGFKVKFVGEASDDYGGPYRETISNICNELQSPTSPLMLLSPNGQHALGSNRSSYTPRPSASHAADLAHFRFFGKLIGCSLLQRDTTLDLELSPHVWKILVGSRLEAVDLAAFDEAAFNSLVRLRHIEEEGVSEARFGELFFESFEVQLSDGTPLELMPSGANTPVTFHSRGRFCDLALSARLTEGAAQLGALLAGISSLVPCSRLLSLLTHDELSYLACGEADVDVEALRSHTRYGAGVNPKHRHIALFWSVLEDLSSAQRRLFLQFIWGRTRLPSAEQWGEQHMRVHTLDTRLPDLHLPIAHTCFFSIEWPRYTSQKIARSKLLYAITNCREIDADNTREGRANAMLSSAGAGTSDSS